jgi:tRNA-specific 2-thiouridylase
MSGGVDSSVAAALLVEQGYDVTGMMLRLWSETGKEDSNRCCTPDAMTLARRVAAHLGIPFYAVDVREPFYTQVVETFIAGYANGVTPNPCIACNRTIRWGVMLAQARALGADFLATGHYARLNRAEGQPVALLKAVDERKDQSYVLAGLTQAQLAASFFPLGELTKPEVREIARRLRLPVAERADSQDLCFLAGEDYRAFLSRRAPTLAQPGPIFNRAGQTIGQHTGLIHYTIGQRKGLGIASPEPLYVIEKSIPRNALVVGPLAELGSSVLTAGPVNWISGQPVTEPVVVDVKIRYKAIPARATLTPLLDDRAQIAFEQPLRDITPGQLAVFYQGEKVLGSGIILT